MNDDNGRYTILVVDDDLMSIEMLIGILATDYHVVTVQSGAEALELLIIMQPDMILMDVIMPEMDGYQVYEKLKEMPGMREIPLIFLTCMTDNESESRGLEMGAVDYITKPYNPQLIRSRVRNHLFLKDRLDLLMSRQQALDAVLKEQNRIQDELKKSEQRFRAIVDSSCNLENWMGTDGKIIWTNAAVYRLTGYTVDEYMALPDVPFSLIHKDDYALISKVFEADQRCKCPNAVECRICTKDGGLKWVTVAYYSLFDDSGVSLGYRASINDITERKQAEEKLRTSEEQLRTISESANDAILMMDPQGIITYWNPAAEHILGYRFKEAMGKNLHDLLAPKRFHLDHHAAFPGFLQTGQGNAVGKTLELSAIRKDGQEIDVAVSLSGVFLYGAWHAVGIIHDITERKRYERELEQARDAADAANRAKSEFLANMSHEIRTPMNGVIGMAQLLRFTTLTPEQNEYLNSIDVSADNLLQLLNDILDLTKIESGKIELEYADFSLRKAVEDVITTQKSRILEKNLTLQKEFSVELPEVLCGDQLRLKQILLNLLGNAIKFTEKGSITISIKVLERDAARVLVRLSISDTGIGMTQEAMLKIFNPFVQADSSTTRRFGGTGLGLTICRQLADLMGGSICVESTLYRGSIFHLELPFELSASRHQRDATPVAASLISTGRVLNVLVAEDNQLNQRMFEMILDKIGHKAICANNGKEALERWRKGGIDLILMDIQMPVMGGVEALQVIRSEEQGNDSHIPIIALTADALKGVEEQLLQAGFDSYLTKPIKIKLLIDELERLTDCTNKDTLCQKS